MLNNEILTVADVAKIIKTNKNYIYDCINSGFLKATKLGSYKIKQEWLEEFIDENMGVDLSNPYQPTKIIKEMEDETYGKN